MFYFRMVIFLAIAALFTGCEAENDERILLEAEEAFLDPDDQIVAAQDAWWANMMAHCNHAYGGRLVLEPEGDEMLTGAEELVVHFRTCTEAELRLPFHIEKPEEDDWDRSRTWIFSRTIDAIELRHDHRERDGSESDQTMYGGFTVTEGTGNRQEFRYEPRSTEEGVFLGWRVEIEPGVRYTYGTIRGDEFTWRVDFDLSEPVETPPAPWGHE